MSSFVVSSAAGLGYGTLRVFRPTTGWGAFGPPSIHDPRGVRRRPGDPYLVVNEPAAVWLLTLDGDEIARIELPAGLEPGGGAFSPSGGYYIGSRAKREIERLDLVERRYCGTALTFEHIDFPRGFAVLDDTSFIVASGTHPVTKKGRRALFRFGAANTDGDLLVDDPELDPLDLAYHDGSVYVTSEFPFGSDRAVVSLRRYDAQSGKTTGLWSGENTPAFSSLRKPRGIAVTDDRTLAICAQNCVVSVDVTTSGAARILAEDDRLAGQSLALL